MGRPEPAAARPQAPPGTEGAPDDWDATDGTARARLIDEVYPQLKKIAERQMRRERHDHTLQPTALVNEFFLIMARQKPFSVNGPAHFLAIASQAMRRILIDHARSHNAARRGGAVVNVQLDPEALPAAGNVFDMIQLDEALERLSGEHPRAAKVVELKCFGGLTFSEVGQVLRIDERTAKRDWEFARAQLYGYLKPGKP